MNSEKDNINQNHETAATPLISVIVPVYNAEKTLRQCADSILGQVYKDFELILIDDGSKDSSSAICDEYAIKDNRVKVFHKANGGVSSARNLGLEHALGEWITFIDSDDYISDRYLDDIVNRNEDLIFKGYKKFNNVGVHYIWNAESVRYDLGLTSFLNENITDSLLRGPVFKFYKKNIIGDLRFLQDMRIGEDAYFVFRYIAKCKNYAVLSKGSYMVRMADEPDDIKYAISVDYAISSLQYLQGAFDDLVKVHHIKKALFLSYIGYFKRISKGDWITDRDKWYHNSEIKRIYDYVWPSLNWRQKMRLCISRLLKK